MTSGFHAILKAFPLPNSRIMKVFPWYFILDFKNILLNLNLLIHIGFILVRHSSDFFSWDVVFQYHLLNNPTFLIFYLEMSLYQILNFHLYVLGILLVFCFIGIYVSFPVPINFYWYISMKIFDKIVLWCFLGVLFCFIGLSIFILVIKMFSL